MNSRTLSVDPHAKIRVLASIYERCAHSAAVTYPVVFLLQELDAVDFGYSFHPLWTGMICLQVMWDLGTVRRVGLRVSAFVHPFLADMEDLQPWGLWMDVAARVVYRRRRVHRRFTLGDVYTFLCPRRYFYLDPYVFRALWGLLMKYGVV